jgi:hypothetical protein
MNFRKWIQYFVFIGLVLILQATAYSAPPFQVEPTTLSFGELTLGGSKTLSFKVKNLQATQLAITMRQVTAFFSINPGGLCQPCTLNLAPNETKEVQVTYPGLPRCIQINNSPLTLTVGSDQVTVGLNAKLICPELDFVGGGIGATLQGNSINVSFRVINTGTVPSVACTAQILQDGTLAQSVDMPAFSTEVPDDQRLFQQLIPTTPGPHLIEVLLDTNNLNQEADEGNKNKRGATISVPTPTPPPPPPPSPVTISVTKTGSGTGTVTAEGINCGTDCSSSVDQNTRVTLSAQPAFGSSFIKWSGGTGSATICDEATRPTCVFTASSSSRITATFELTK